MARAHIIVPQNDFSVAGMRVQYAARYRGTDIVLTGTVQYRIWDRNYGCNFYRVQPDHVEAYDNLTTYALSVRESNLIRKEVTL